MKILLDTCAFIWAINDPDKLTEPARTSLTAPDSIIFFSPITCAEIVCLTERKRITLDRHWKTWFDTFTKLNQWQSIPIDIPIIQDAFSLPSTFHADPVDRIITATARVRQLQLITADKKLIDYPFVDTIW
ncbi:MAG: type II toxin-antitoxin system VapC family toxin [Spartobacteria bacterium]|nr:type II toxin-antitoxin system VapC family toxin [Spartobacteria bacterium]